MGDTVTLLTIDSSPGWWLVYRDPYIDLSIKTLYKWDGKISNTDSKFAPEGLMFGRASGFLKRETLFSGVNSLYIIC